MCMEGAAAVRLLSPTWRSCEMRATWRVTLSSRMFCDSSTCEEKRKHDEGVSGSWGCDRQGVKMKVVWAVRMGCGGSWVLQVGGAVPRSWVGRETRGLSCVNAV